MAVFSAADLIVTCAKVIMFLSSLTSLFVSGIVHKLLDRLSQNSVKKDGISEETGETNRFWW